MWSVEILHNIKNFLSRDIHMTQVLVHGEQNEMARLRAALVREYEDNEVMIASPLVM